MDSQAWLRCLSLHVQTWVNNNQFVVWNAEFKTKLELSYYISTCKVVTWTRPHRIGAVLLAPPKHHEAPLPYLKYSLNKKHKIINNNNNNKNNWGAMGPVPPPILMVFSILDLIRPILFIAVKLMLFYRT